MQTTTTHNKSRLLILGRVGGGGVTARRLICLHSSVSCIGILSLSDCNESVAWSATGSALSPSDFASLTGGWDAWDPTPGGGPWTRELRGELLLCGGAAGSSDPFGRVPLPAAPRPAVKPSPFGIVSGLTGPERTDRGAERQHVSADKIQRRGARRGELHVGNPVSFFPFWNKSFAEKKKKAWHVSLLCLSSQRSNCSIKYRWQLLFAVGGEAFSRRIKLNHNEWRETPSHNGKQIAESEGKQPTSARRE